MFVQVQIAASVPEEIDARLTALAEMTGRSKDDLVVEALQIFMLADHDLEASVLTKADFIKDVEEGLREAGTGEVVDHEEVVAEFERRFGPRR